MSGHKSVVLKDRIPLHLGEALRQGIHFRLQLFPVIDLPDFCFPNILRLGVDRRPWPFDLLIEQSSAKRPRLRKGAALLYYLECYKNSTPTCDSIVVWPRERNFLRAELF